LDEDEIPSNKNHRKGDCKAAVALFVCQHLWIITHATETDHSAGNTVPDSRPWMHRAEYAKEDSARFIMMSQAIQSILCHSSLTKSFLFLGSKKAVMKHPRELQEIGATFRQLIGSVIQKRATIFPQTTYGRRSV
jgi:hypothetical protein